MKQIEKRLNKLEAVTPKEDLMTDLGELYEWQNTPEGQAELAELYNENRYDKSE